VLIERLTAVQTNRDESLFLRLRLLLDEIVEDLARNGTEETPEWRSAPQSRSTTIVFGVISVFS
jgi:hypothetical protein